jgi:hypothetical protein
VRLTEAGLLPIVTATEFPGGASPEEDPGDLHAAFRRLLLDAGVTRPRLKILPLFPLGKLASPSAGEPVTESMLAGAAALPQCVESRAVTAAGIYACPILVGQPSARLASTLEEADAVTLSHPACRTCLETGMTCRNA